MLKILSLHCIALLYLFCCYDKQSFLKNCLLLKLIVLWCMHEYITFDIQLTITCFCVYHKRFEIDNCQKLVPKLNLGLPTDIETTLPPPPINPRSIIFDVCSFLTFNCEHYCCYWEDWLNSSVDFQRSTFFWWGKSIHA